MDKTSVAPAQPPKQRPRGMRRYELDWLRSAACFGLIPFHTAVIFTAGAYDYVKNAQTSVVMNTLTSFITVWGIPLLFVVAGGSARYALQARSVRRFLNERVMRLLVPLVFGMALIVPFQVYIGRLSGPAPAPPYWVFYGQFLWSLALIVTGKLPRGPDWIGHLWFLPPLMVFAVLLIPLAWALRTPRGRQAVEWLAGALRGAGPLALFGLPLALANWLAIEGVRWMATTDTAFASNAIGLVAYLLFFLYGYLLYLDERFLASVRRDTWLALALGAVCWLALRYAIPQQGGVLLGNWSGRVALALMRGYSGWWWVMGILGLGIRYLRFTNAFERYLARAAYPIYIIHMPILSLIAFWIVRLDTDIAAKFTLIILASLAASLLTYEYLIRRSALLRMLFGLTAAAAPSVAAASRAGPALVRRRRQVSR